MNEEWTWSSCAQTEKTELKVAYFHWYVWIQCSYVWYSIDVDLSKDSSYSYFKSAVIVFSHIDLFIAPRMSKLAVHHFWDLGRKWLNQYGHQYGQFCQKSKSKVKVSFIVNSATCTVHTYRELKLRYSLTRWCIQITLNTTVERTNTDKYKSIIYIQVLVI